eukprot:TRINITY_DN0_c235_g1_i1.p1 TRINITY_DN0_c235_g1~~TRINITY_DN0_c235_g1_i1.p1  ORF type:complete len:123 (+),score=7.56 TRINITY_DN0_c235_g1_i1:75-443(+)
MKQKVEILPELSESLWLLSSHTQSQSPLSHQENLHIRKRIGKRTKKGDRLRRRRIGVKRPGAPHNTTQYIIKANGRPLFPVDTSVITLDSMIDLVSIEEIERRESIVLEREQPKCVLSTDNR